MHIKVDIFVESALFFHFYVGSGAHTQVIHWTSSLAQIRGLVSLCSQVGHEITKTCELLPPTQVLRLQV